MYLHDFNKKLIKNKNKPKYSRARWIAGGIGGGVGRLMKKI